MDLRQFVASCEQHDLKLFAVRRADIEYFARDIEGRGRATATVARRLSTVAGARPLPACDHLVVEGITDEEWKAFQEALPDT